MVCYLNMGTTINVGAAASTRKKRKRIRTHAMRGEPGRMGRINAGQPFNNVYFRIDSPGLALDVQRPNRCGDKPTTVINKFRGIGACCDPERVGGAGSGSGGEETRAADVEMRLITVAVSLASLVASA